MNRIAKIILACACCLILISSCNDTEKPSPYSEILNRPPFASLTDSIKRDPKNEELWFRRAVLLNSNSFREPALADFQKAWSFRKDERFAVGISNLLLEKKADSAIQFLGSALKELPESFLLQLSLARGYAATGNTEQAIITCDGILLKNPESVDVIKLKADLLDKKNQPLDATRLLEQAYRLAPFDVELNYVLALRYAEGKNPAVLVICDSLIRADTEGRHAEPYYYKGIYYSNTGDKAKALVLFDEAVKHDYYFLDGYIEKGSLLCDMKKFDEALATLNLALTISPKFADAYYWIAKCQEATGKKEEAKVNYLRAYELDKTLTEAKTAADRIMN